MKALGAEFRHDATAIGDLRTGPHGRADGIRQDGIRQDGGVAGLFVSRRRDVRAATPAPAIPAPLVLRDPEMPGAPPDSATGRAAWIARHLEADCFHFVEPETTRRGG